MAETVEGNAHGDATRETVAQSQTIVEENLVEQPTTTIETSTTEKAVESTEQTTATTPETTATDSSGDKPSETDAAVDTAPLKRKAEDVNEEGDVDETKKSKVDETSVENESPTNGHTEEAPVVEELLAVPAKTVEDVARLTAEAEENAA